MVESSLIKIDEKIRGMTTDRDGLLKGTLTWKTESKAKAQC